MKTTTNTTVYDVCVVGSTQPEDTFDTRAEATRYVRNSRFWDGTRRTIRARTEPSVSGATTLAESLGLLLTPTTDGYLLCPRWSTDPTLAFVSRSFTAVVSELVTYQRRLSHLTIEGM